MITMDALQKLTKSKVSLKGKKNVTLTIEPDLSAEDVVRNLEEYFGKRTDQKSVKLVFESGATGYLRRDDLYSLVAVSKRGIGDSDGATLPGMPSDVRFIELCCMARGCPEVLLVTSYDELDPPKCGVHGKSKMKPCDEAR